MRPAIRAARPRSRDRPTPRTDALFSKLAKYAVMVRRAGARREDGVRGRPPRIADAVEQPLVVTHRAAVASTTWQLELHGDVVVRMAAGPHRNSRLYGLEVDVGDRVR